MDNTLAAPAPQTATPDVAAARRKPESKLRYPIEPPPSDGTLVEIVPGLLWARVPMPMSLDHINCYLLRDSFEGRDGWAVVDTGLGIPRTHEVWEKIFGETLAGQPMTRLICTHCHYDHAGAARWMQERFDVPLLMTYGEFMMLRGLMGPPPDPLPDMHRLFYERAGVSDEQLDEMVGAMRKDPFMPQAPFNYQRLRAGQVLTIGEREWRVIVGEGHSPEHACLYNARDGLLIAGDQLLPRITSNVMVSPMEPEGNPLQVWLESTLRLAELPADTLVLPSHQGVFLGVRERAHEVVTHHEQQFDQLRAHLATVSGASARELMLVLFTRLRGPVDHLMALGETIAHLNQLLAAGELQRVRGAGKIDTYALARQEGKTT